MRRLLGGIRSRIEPTAVLHSVQHGDAGDA